MLEGGLCNKAGKPLHLHGEHLKGSMHHPHAAFALVVAAACIDFNL